MGTKKFRKVGIAAFLMMVLACSPVALAVAPVAEEATQEQSVEALWAPVQFLLQVWKAIVNVGGPPDVGSEEAGLTQAQEEDDPDFGPSIDPNGRSL